MPALLIAVAVLTTVVAGAAWYRLHRLRRALHAERAARRLTAGMHHRDMQAFHTRINALLEERAVIQQAEQVLDTALATHHSNPEGGHP